MCPNETIIIRRVDLRARATRGHDARRSGKTRDRRPLPPGLARMRARRALLVAVAIAILALARCGASASDARAPDAVADVADVAHRASAAAAAAAASARDDDDRLPLARRPRSTTKRIGTRTEGGTGSG